MLYWLHEHHDSFKCQCCWITLCYNGKYFEYFVHCSYVNVGKINITSLKTVSKLSFTFWNCCMQPLYLFIIHVYCFFKPKSTLDSLTSCDVRPCVFPLQVFCLEEPANLSGVSSYWPEVMLSKWPERRLSPGNSVSAQSRHTLSLQQVSRTLHTAPLLGERQGYGRTTGTGFKMTSAGEYLTLMVLFNSRLKETC